MSGPGVRSSAAPAVRGNAGTGVARNWQGNSWQGNNRQGDRHHHGRHFRGGPFFGAYAYTYPYYDDHYYYGYDRCAYAEPYSWWWRRYCAPHYRYRW
jgi:hypothetical protein